MSSTPEPARPDPENRRRFEDASLHCFACGSENAVGMHLHVSYDAEAHRAETVVTLPVERQGWTGVAHGGVVSTILDELLSWSLGQEVLFFTVELTVRYRRPVPLGVPLRAWGQRTRLRGRYMEAEGEIRGPDGELLASAAGKFLSPPADRHGRDGLGTAAGTPADG